MKMPDSVYFRVEGISTQTCANRIDTTLHAYDNVELVRVSIPDKTVTVTGDKLDEGKIRRTIEAMGFDVIGNKPLA